MTIHCRHVTCHQCECASCEVLRRERDEARAECSKLHEQLREGCTCGSGGHPRHCERHPGAYESHVELLNTETALDEARAKVDDLKSELRLTQMKLRIERERHSADMAKSHVETFERTKERDEARAEVERLREALSASHDRAEAEMGWFVQAIRERDEARAELDEIKADFRTVVNGQCKGDEHHCSCVPALRAEIERLREALSRIAAFDTHEGTIARVALKKGNEP